MIRTTEPLKIIRSGRVFLPPGNKIKKIQLEKDKMKQEMELQKQKDAEA